MYLLVAEAELLFQSANILHAGKDTAQLERMLKKATKHHRAEKNIKDRKDLICLAYGKKILREILIM